MKLVLFVMLCAISVAYPCEWNCAMFTDSVPCINYDCPPQNKCAWCVSSKTCIQVDMKCPYNNGTLIPCEGEILSKVQCPIVESIKVFDDPISFVLVGIMGILLGVLITISSIRSIKKDKPKSEDFAYAKSRLIEDDVSLSKSSDPIDFV